MRIRIVEIDFARHRAWLDAVESDENRGLMQLDAVLALARTRGLTDIRIRNRVGESHMIRRALIEVVGRHGAILTREKSPSNDPATNGLTSTPDSSGGIEYSLRFDDLKQTVERMGTAVVMVGLAANLDDVARNQLRFFAYELAVNSVEHGRFSSRPEIRLDVAVGDRIMELVYRDNAEPFVTDEHTALDLADKIANSEKRGFGLYILNQMGKSFNYERKDGWNTTTLTARLDKQSTQSSDRRSDMDGITVEVVPCNLRVTAILKPAGSIDSSTAQVFSRETRGS
jgi:anti-sigma regulatory factor (Ser/Thr protein kinase)